MSKELASIIEQNTLEPTYKTLTEFIEFKNSKKWRDYKELLPAFATYMGFNLIVKNPDEAKKKHQIGEANGKDIIVYEEWGFTTFYFSYFHEMGHNIMHFKNGVVINRDMGLIELEADTFSLMMCISIFPEQEENFRLIAHDNPVSKSLLNKYNKN